MSAEAYLPSLDDARAQGLEASTRSFMMSVDLLGGEPEEVTALAVVILDARVLHRNAEERQIQLPAKTVDGLSRATPPAPETWVEDERHTQLVERHGDVTDCEACEYKRGKLPCAACGARGTILVGSGDDQRRIACPSCEREGWLTCSTCDGAGTAVWVRLMGITDDTTHLRYAYVPSMIDALDLAVGERFEKLPDALPEALRFDPEPQQKQSAYRGDVGQSDHTFHGHGFGDALSRAMTAARGLARGGTVIKQEIKTYAWPLLWLRYDGVMRKGDVALLHSPATRQLEAVVT